MYVYIYISRIYSLYPSFAVPVGQPHRTCLFNFKRAWRGVGLCFSRVDQFFFCSSRKLIWWPMEIFDECRREPTNLLLIFSDERYKSNENLFWTFGMTTSPCWWCGLELGRFFFLVYLFISCRFLFPWESSPSCSEIFLTNQFYMRNSIYVIYKMCNILWGGLL
jgi:hypothetical protein